MLQLFLLLFSLSAFAAENLPAPPPPPPTNLDMGAMRASLLSQDIDTQKIKMRNLPYRSRLIFPNDTQNPKGIVIGKYLGGDGMSAVYEVLSPSELGVVKLPQYYAEKNEEAATAFIDAFKNGDEILKKYGVSKVELTSYLPHEYVTVSRLPLDVIRPLDLRHRSREEQLEALEALKRFTKQTAAFDNIGDFKWTDLHYSPEKKTWILADWANIRVSGNYYHVLFNPDLPVGVEYSENARSFFGLLGLGKTTSGFRFMSDDSPFPFSALSPEERQQAARDIESEIIEQRRSLVLSDDYRSDFSTHGHLSGDAPFSLIETDVPLSGELHVVPLKKNPVRIQLWRPTSSCKARLAV